MDRKKSGTEWCILNSYLGGIGWGMLDMSKRVDLKQIEELGLHSTSLEI
jgi:hypothetical protein